MAGGLGHRRGFQLAMICLHTLPLDYVLQLRRLGAAIFSVGAILLEGMVGYQTG
jgi:hypothetical protein